MVHLLIIIVVVVVVVVVAHVRCICCHVCVSSHLVLNDGVDEVLLWDIEVNVLRSARGVSPRRGEGVVEAPVYSEERGGRGGDERGGRGGKRGERERGGRGEGEEYETQSLLTG